MSAESVILTALDSDEAKRTSGLDELASLVADALAVAGLLAETSPRRCRWQVLASGTVERYLRCTLDLRHEGEHSAQQNSTTTVSFTDEQAAGVLRERV